ncbi:hypothetical protein [Anaeroselena agilis]|uniref:Rubredoxin n=1 Tax=Anaeroselena agilis TaxID=3063788 RepID=A0ABU3NX36_9FIRM|nr:hypothetical protein [Selenomonadales bacterium 4137-cl]
MRRFVCPGCGRVWYSAALADEPCDACGARLREVAVGTGERDGE